MFARSVEHETKSHETTIRS